MKLESDILTYVLYKYIFLLIPIITVLVFIVIITGDGSNNEGWLANLFGLSFGAISFIIFIFLRNTFVRVRLDINSFEILNGTESMNTWNDIESIDFLKHFDGILFKFKLKTEGKFRYSLTDRPTKIPLFNPYKNRAYETEMGLIIHSKKRELGV